MVGSHGGAHFSGDDAGCVEDTLAALGLRRSRARRRHRPPVDGRTAAARAVRSLARRPRVLLLDEPTASLDPASVGRAEALLASCLADGMTVLVVTHAAEQARRLAHRIFHLEHGKLTARMNAIHLGAWDLLAAAILILLDAALSLALRLGLHRQILVAAVRMVVQLLSSASCCATCSRPRRPPRRWP